MPQSRLAYPTLHSKPSTDFRKLLGLWVAVNPKLEKKIGRDARSLSVRRPGTDEIIPTGLAFIAGFQRRRPHVVAQATGKGLVRGKARIEALQDRNGAASLAGPQVCAVARAHASRKADTCGFANLRSTTANILLRN
jgi:hypothetical protein